MACHVSALFFLGAQWMSSAVAVLWLLSGLFSGLFGGGDGHCHDADEQAVRTMRRIAEQWPLRMVEDPVSEYVQRIGLRLARVVDPQYRQPWDFYVLRNTEPIAFAVGDGHFLVSDGLIAFVRNESQLAAVLAHEISHQSLGHFCRQISQAMERIDRGTVVQQYALRTEEEADREAIHLLIAAGFDPAAMESVLRCLDRLPEMTGPDLEKRVRALRRRGTPGEGGGNTNAAEFRRVRELVAEDLGDTLHPECH